MKLLKPFYASMKIFQFYKFVALSVMTAVLAVSNVNAAYDAFLKIEGPDVKGESQADGRENEIDILSFSWGVSNPSAQALHGGGSGGGKVTLSELTITKRTDKASPQLFRNAVLGQAHSGAEGHYPIRLVMVYTPADHGEPVEMFSIELNDCQIAELRSTVVPAKRGSDDEPSETLSLSFEQIRMNASVRDGHGGYTGLTPERAIEVDNPALED